MKGFELPLLSSFKNKDHAAVIYEGIKQRGTEQEECYSVEQFATELYQKLFNLEITGKTEKMTEELTVGSLISHKKKEKNTLLDVYIGDEYYSTVDDVEVEKEDEEEVSDLETDEKGMHRQVIIETIDLEDLLVQELPESRINRVR